MTEEVRIRRYLFTHVIIETSLNNFCSFLCTCVECVGLSINEIINIMFYYSFYLLSLVYLLSIYLQMSFLPVSLPHSRSLHFSYLVLHTNQNFTRILHLLYSINQCRYLLKFLRWLVITIRYKVVCLLCLIMLKILVKLTK